MEKIIITIQITDPETVENYKDCHQDIIFEDLQSGTLMEICELVKVEIKNA